MKSFVTLVIETNQHSQIAIFKMAKSQKIIVRGTEITILKEGQYDFISLTDMLKAKDGDFFISDWLRNRNTVEFLGIWESVYNPDFNYGEFAIIKSQAGLNNYRISAKDWVENGAMQTPMLKAISATRPPLNNWSCCRTGKA